MDGVETVGTEMDGFDSAALDSGYADPTPNARTAATTTQRPTVALERPDRLAREPGLVSAVSFAPTWRTISTQGLENLSNSWRRQPPGASIVRLPLRALPW